MQKPPTLHVGKPKSRIGNYYFFHNFLIIALYTLRMLEPYMFVKAAKECWNKTTGDFVCSKNVYELDI